MKQFKNLKPYTQVARGLSFQLEKENPYILFYFPENALLLDTYPLLNLRIIDFKNIVVPVTKIPRTRLLGPEKKLYRTHKLYAFSTNERYPVNKNLIFDYSPYLNSIDTTYKPTNYRQRAGFLITNLTYMTTHHFPDNYRKIFLYNVVLENGFDPSIINRKIFPLVKQIKEGSFEFDDFLLCITHSGVSTYRLLGKDGQYSFPRLFQYLKTMKPVDVEEEENVQLTKATNNIVNQVSPTIPTGNKDTIKTSISSYLSSSPKDLEKVSSGNITKDDAERIAVASLLYRTSGNLSKATKISKSIPKNKRKVALKSIDKQLIDELLKPQKSENLSSQVIVQTSNVQNIVDNKTPEHIFEKREVDYKVNLAKDMTNAFKMLENKEVPLNVIDVRIVEQPDKPEELDPTDKSIIYVKLKDKSGKEHEIQIDVPRIDPKTGTFRVYGQKKCLINQIIQCPITFPKPHQSRFESSYSKFRIWSVISKRMNYLNSYMGGCKIPLLIMLSYAFGFEKTLKQYGISYNISDVKPSKDTKFTIKINNGSYISFTNVDTPLKEQLVNSFIYTKPGSFDIDYEFGNKMYFNELIISLTGRINSTYLITSNIENIVTPVAHQILLNQQLPTDLDQIMKYMATNCVLGTVIKRNDLANQRIRNSEVIVDLAQSRILAAYTDYKEQILSGNADAQFTINKGVVLSDFNKVENVVSMEYANPLEEMATFSRVTPTGKTVGGIPDKRAITTDALNVDKSYFGNIDLYDTPEGENIGVVQQLTVDAYITSARGLFHIKPIKDGENSGLLSTTTAMIPFVSHNDGNRIMMAASQAKQMLPLKNPEPPIIQSGYESLLPNVLTDSFIKKSPCTGKITNITQDAIYMTCTGNKKNVIDITPIHLKSGTGKDTLSVFNPKVLKGEIVKKGSIIAEGSCISQGMISLGRTLLVAVMPYKGFNYEDGVAISEKLVTDDKLTSLHGIIEEITMSENDRLIHIAKIGDKTKKGEPIFRKSVGEIEELIGFDEEEESLDISAGQLIKKSPGGTIVDIEVFSNVSDDKFPQLKDLIDRTRRLRGAKKGKFTVRGQSIKGVLIKFKIEQELQIGLGDKLANRHGNKGIISVVEKEENMPRTPWGERVEIVLNPLGIIGRMNPGQIYELYCGLISKELANRTVKLKSKSEIINLYQKVLSTLDNTKNKKFSTDFIKNFKGLNTARFNLMIEQVSKSGFSPIVVPPFQTPTYKNILQTMKILGLKSGYKLYIPEYNTKTNYEVPVGYMYITKLEHMGDSKLHARSTGPVTSKTMQPSVGKRREGGQRLGEMDTYSFLSYNATSTLAELMGPMSDDHISKNEMISEIIQTGSAEYKVTQASPAKDLLNAYMISLMLAR